MYELNIKEFLPELQKDFEAQPCFPIIQQQYLFVAINVVNPKANDRNGDSCFLACIELDKKNVRWCIEFNLSKDSTINNEFLIENDYIFISTFYSIHCIHKMTGKVIWENVFKKHIFSHLSICDDKLFFSKWGELQELNKENGKVLQTIKPRVNWFDSGVTKFNGRYFISTSNSRILELNISKLEKINEFRFPGTWAIGVTPLFYENEMISSSFGSKILFFDLSTNQAGLKFNKTAGGEPLQIVVGDKFLSYEGSRVNNLSCYDIKSKKKKWKVVLPKVEYLRKASEESFFAVYKKDNNYVVGLIDLNNGKENKVIFETRYADWETYEYRLWKGVKVDISKDYEVYAIEPNKISVKCA